MKQLTRIKRSFLKRVLAFFSFTTALFIFQACYGVAQDFYSESLYIEGNIKDKNSKEAIEGIQIWLEDSELCLTDNEGKFDAFIGRKDTVNLSFRDIDGNELGAYSDKDSSFVIENGYSGSYQDSLYFTVYLSEVEE